MLPAKSNLLITATAYKANLRSLEYLIKKETKFIKVRSTQNAALLAKPDITKLNAGDSVTILDKQVDLSVVNSVQVVTGKIIEVLDTETQRPVQNATIKITPLNFTTCPTQTFLSGSDGVFTSDNFFILSSGNHAVYNLLITIPGYINYESNIFIGGLGWFNPLDLGDIELIKPVLYVKSTISGKIISSVTNQNLENVQISLFSGYRDFTNSTSDSNKLITSVTSGSDGTYSFSNLIRGEYSLLFQKEDTYDEFRIAMLSASQKILDVVAMTPYVKDGQIRFVLSWRRSPKDLDLLALFRVNRFTQCDVFFGKQQCGQVSLEADSFNYGVSGVETITINTFGRYYYALLVNKFSDHSNETTIGDNPVPDYTDDDNPQVDITKPFYFKDVPLISSDSKISVYVPGPKTSILQVTIPNEIPASSNVTDPNRFRWWLALCLDGNKGPSSIAVVNIISTTRPNISICENLYKK